MDSQLDVSRLESLLESAKVLSSSLELKAQLSHLMRTVMGRLVTTRGLIALRDGEGMRVAISRGLPAAKPGSAFDERDAEQLGLWAVRPLGDPADPAGMIGVGRPAKGDLEAGEIEFLQALLSLAGAAIANSKAHDEVVRTNLALDQKIEELRAILDLVRALAQTIEPEDIAQSLMLTLSGRWAVTRHALQTWKPRTEPIRRIKGAISNAQTFRDALGESDVPVEHGEFVLFPIRSSNSSVGVVALGPRPGGVKYSAADRELISGMVAQATVAIENAWHFQDALVRRQLEQELTLAAGIQKELFPKQLPVLPRTEMLARNRQAKQVGGDYYDVLGFGAGGPEAAHLACVADISGKGLSAALLMANIQASLRALLTVEKDLKTIAAMTNELLYASTAANKYGTAFLLRYEPQTGECEYVNAGHSEGVVLRAGGAVELLGSTGVPLGLLPKREYESQRLHLDQGDLAMLYSDGVTDACTNADEEYGLERAVECLKRNRELSLAEIVERLYESIDEFAAGAPQFDDITVMVIRRTG